MQFMPATVALLVAVGFLACDRSAVVEPEPENTGTEETALEPGGAFFVNCEANVETESIRCAREDSDPRSDIEPDEPADLDGGLAVRVTIGGQGQYVQLTSSNVCSGCTTADIFEADVTIQNLLPQSLGALGNGSGTQIYVPFHDEPTNGVTVVIDNVYSFVTGSGFTRSGPQPFMAYPFDSVRVDNGLPWLEPGETSKPLKWQFDISSISGSTFTFTVFVYADVPYPDGFVDVTPDTGTVEVGQSTQFTAVARDLVGREVTGRTITWTSLDPAAVSIDNTGLATGSVNRAALIVAESDGPEAPDTVTAWAFEDLSDRVRTTTPYDPDGPRNFRFVISSGGAWQAGEAGASAARALRLPDWPADQTLAGTGRSSTFGLHDIEGTSSVVGFATDSIDTTTLPASSGADLRVRYGKPPDLSIPFNIDAYDEPHCNSYFSNNPGLCEFADPADGEWFVTVDQGSDFTEIDVIADYAANDPGFDIELVYTDDALAALSSAQMDSLRSLADRLELVVTSDLTPATSWFVTCFLDRGPEYFATDDLLILVDTFNDAPSGTLGSGGACATRDSNMLTALGALSLDEADFAGTLGDPTGFNDVSLHELTHVLGLGPLWDDFSLVTGIGSDPVYIGAGGILGYENVGGPTATDVPVEDMGGSGTINAHWRESVFETELMTGFYNGTSVANEFSEMTIRSLEDLGYTVDVNQADPYTVPSSSAVLDPSLSEPIPFGDDIWKGPLYQTTPDGVIRRIR